MLEEAVAQDLWDNDETLWQLKLELSTEQTHEEQFADNEGTLYCSKATIEPLDWGVCSDSL